MTLQAPEDADAEAPPGKRAKVSGDTAAESTEASEPARFGAAIVGVKYAVDVSSDSSAAESCASDADAEALPGMRAKVPGDVAAESTEAPGGGVTQPYDAGNAAAERSAAPGTAAPAAGGADLDLARRLKRNPRTEIRYRLDVDRFIDEALEARTMCMWQTLKKEHYHRHSSSSRVFDYAPLVHGWLQRCWNQSLKAMQDIQKASSSDNCIHGC